jgi:predicted transcriptional regulator with HTH domain
MSKNILDNLFGSKVRLKMLKFLFRNYPNPVTVGRLSLIIQESPSAVRREIQMLREIRLLKKK